MSGDLARSLVPASRRRFVVGSVAFLLGLTLLALPVGLAMSGHLSERTLSHLSEIGQAYGTLSVALSSVALLGVIASVLYVARQTRIQRTEAWWSTQSELLQIVIREPRVFGPCLGSLHGELTAEEYRQYTFTTLWLSYIRMGMEIGYFSDGVARARLIADMFKSPTALKLFNHRLVAYSEMPLPPGSFEKLVMEEYERALARQRVATGKPPSNPRQAGQRPNTTESL